MPDNAIYFQAAYVATAVIHLVYGLSLWRRRRQLERRRAAAARTALSAEGSSGIGGARR